MLLLMGSRRIIIIMVVYNVVQVLRSELAGTQYYSVYAHVKPKINNLSLFTDEMSV